MKMSQSEYHAHENSFDGYCTNCDDITRWGETEGDADGYECPECEGLSCLGMMNALVDGHIQFKGEDNG